jgi:hypothetical protein
MWPAQQRTPAGRARPRCAAGERTERAPPALDRPARPQRAGRRTAARAAQRRRRWRRRPLRARRRGRGPDLVLDGVAAGRCLPRSRWAGLRGRAGQWRRSPRRCLDFDAEVVHAGGFAGLALDEDELELGARRWRSWHSRGGAWRARRRTGRVEGNAAFARHRADQPSAVQTRSLATAGLAHSSAALRLLCLPRLCGRVLWRGGEAGQQA